MMARSLGHKSKNEVNKMYETYNTVVLYLSLAWLLLYK